MNTNLIEAGYYKLSFPTEELSEHFNPFAWWYDVCRPTKADSGLDNSVTGDGVTGIAGARSVDADEPQVELVFAEQPILRMKTDQLELLVLAVQFVVEPLLIRWTGKKPQKMLELAV